MEQSARSNAPSALLTRLGLPQTSAFTDARDLVLYRQPDGTVVLLPASVVAAAETSGGFALASGEDLGSIAPGSGKDAAPGGNAYGATQGGKGGNSAGNTQSGSQGEVTSPDGATDPGNDGDNQPTHTPPPSRDVNQGGDAKGKNGVPPAPTPKSTPKSTPTPTDPATAESYSTVAPPSGRVAGSPTPASTAPVRSSVPPGNAGATGTPSPTGSRSSGVPSATGTRTSGSGSSGVATRDPGTDSSTSTPASDPRSLRS
jgi:hypothetical protein